MKNEISYEAPAVTILGKVEQLTLSGDYCDKTEGGADGFTFHGDPIQCTSA